MTERDRPRRGCLRCTNTRHPTGGHNVKGEVVMSAEGLLRHGGLHVSSCGAIQAQGWARVLFDRVRRRLCQMLGHNLTLHNEPGRLSVQCADCGWESSGWLIDRPHFVFTYGHPRRKASRRTPIRRSTPGPDPLAGSVSHTRVRSVSRHARRPTSKANSVSLALVKSTGRGTETGRRRHPPEAAIAATPTIPVVNGEAGECALR